MEYYYLDKSEKKGPFTLQELKKEKINRESLVWFEGLQEWTKLKEIESLKEVFVAPPPIPNKILGDGNDKKSVSSSNPFNISNKLVGYYIVWVLIFVVLFILTKTDNDVIQQYSGDVEDFWPFTSEYYAKENFQTRPFLQYDCQTGGVWDDDKKEYTIQPEPCFRGVLAGYDMSEVIIYSLIPAIIFVLRRLFK